MALESFSPAMLMCLRYSISGGALLIGALATGARLPTGREAWRTALYGLMVIAMGTGALAYSEQWISSGMASLFASLQPFWLVGVEALSPSGERLHWPSIGGMLVGLAGVALLMAPGGGGHSVSTQAMLGGFFLMQFGGLMWSVGSIAQRRMESRAHPFVSGGVQQLATGIAFVIPALLDGRHETGMPKECWRSCIWRCSAASSAIAPSFIRCITCPWRWCRFTLTSIRWWRWRWAGGFIANLSVGARLWP